jgi:hypothetical protein
MLAGGYSLQHSAQRAPRPNSNCSTNLLAGTVIARQVAHDIHVRALQARDRHFNNGLAFSVLPSPQRRTDAGGPLGISRGRCERLSARVHQQRRSASIVDCVAATKPTSLRETRPRNPSQCRCTAEAHICAHFAANRALASREAGCLASVGDSVERQHREPAKSSHLKEVPQRSRGHYVGVSSWRCTVRISSTQPVHTTNNCVGSHRTEGRVLLRIEN